MAEHVQLEVGIYQLADDALFKASRTDGTGWDWSWADWQRDWMDATPNRYAYRCLPLTIANQTGWWVKNPVGFTAHWSGRTEPASISFEFDTAADVWGGWINSQFGEGIITWNTPFLFRTKPEGSRLLVCGPINRFVANAHPLTALIESDWMSMSFTMNWKVMDPERPVRFDFGIPLFQVIPLATNVCADLETASVTYQRLSDDPEVTRSYHEWHDSRKRFHEQKASGGVKPDDWQKDYFKGQDAGGRPVAPDHRTKVKAPQVRRGPTLNGPSAASAAGPDAAKSRRAPSLALAAQPRKERSEPMRTQPDPYASTTHEAHAANAPVAEQNGSTHSPDFAVGAAAGQRVDDEWRRWIAENLTLGLPPESVVDAMVSGGITPQESVREVNAALQSPYIIGSERLRNRLAKREWLLASYRKLNRQHDGSDKVERRHKLSRGEFLNDYYSTNRPVIITGMMDDWPALRKWDLDYFAERFGDREVEVQVGREAGANYEIEREKYLTRMKFADFVGKIRNAGVTNDFYLTANNNSLNKKVLPELWEDVVQVPEYLDGRDPLGGYFWLGPAGTITPFHHDLTNNFMAQVVGSKRVKIVPSWDLPMMQNDFHCYSKVDGRVTPPAQGVRGDEPQVLDCTLKAGEILFLPIGCLHYVEGLEVSVTMSFTNFVFDNDFSSFYTTYHGV